MNLNAVLHWKEMPKLEFNDKTAFFWFCLQEGASTHRIKHVVSPGGLRNGGALEEPEQ